MNSGGGCLFYQFHDVASSSTLFGRKGQGKAILEYKRFPNLNSVWIRYAPCHSRIHARFVPRISFGLSISGG